MGEYINPPAPMTKEQYIADYGTEVHAMDFLTYEFNEEEYIIVLCENAMFTAAIVCSAKKELESIKAMAQEEKRSLKFYKMSVEHARRGTGPYVG